MNLYEINAEMQALFLEVDEETGELSDDVFLRLSELSLELEERLEGVALNIKNMTAEKVAIDKEIEELKKRSYALGKNIEKNRYYLSFNMVSSEYKKFSTPRVQATARVNLYVDVFDESLLPEAYKRTVTKIEVKADKNLITNELKKGIEIAGARLATRTSVSIK